MWRLAVSPIRKRSEDVSVVAPAHGPAAAPAIAQQAPLSCPIVVFAAKRRSHPHLLAPIARICRRGYLAVPQPLQQFRHLRRRVAGRTREMDAQLFADYGRITQVREGPPKIYTLEFGSVGHDGFGSDRLGRRDQPALSRVQRGGTENVPRLRDRIATRSAFC